MRLTTSHCKNIFSQKHHTGSRNLTDYLERPWQRKMDKPTEKRTSGRSRHRWEDNITMDFKEMGINKRNWIDSAQDRDYWRAIVKAPLNLWVP